MVSNIGEQTLTHKFMKALSQNMDFEKLRVFSDNSDHNNITVNFKL